ncbi:MAG TPA: hypothetical protein EYN66_10305, partial [Myxococcales bacterium]|nr:hypothetical protein [Myxococcales bacterium]
MATLDDGSCEGIPDGDCDCLGNLLDECGVCGGDGSIPQGACDCEGNPPEWAYDCDGNCILDYDLDGICDDIDDCLDYDGDTLCDAIGCTNPNACNYNPAAVINWGCDMASCFGCTDATACNYDLNATSDNGSCLVPTGCDYCFGSAIADGDTDGDGVCNNEEIPGCQDPTACNYDPIYTDDAGNCFWVANIGWCNCDGDVLDECGVCGGLGIPEGDCDCNGNQLDECGGCGGSGIPAGDCDCNGNQLDALGVCGGPCASDANGNGICDDAEVGECMDSTACNYNP